MQHCLQTPVRELVNALPLTNFWSVWVHHGVCLCSNDEEEAEDGDAKRYRTVELLSSASHISNLPLLLSQSCGGLV